MTAPLTPPPHDQPPPGRGTPATHDDRTAGASFAEAVRAELPASAVVAAAVTVSGALFGLLWVWLAPHVPLISDGRAVFLRNSEGEQAIGADGTFALLGLGFGAVSAALVFWFRRAGGIGVVVALAVGALLASLLAWRLGVWLGPGSDVVARAKSVGKGVVFDAPLRLGAKGMLLAFPLAAMAVHLLLTAVFGPRDPEPAPPWEAGTGPGTADG
ncbi:ABC transporter permease [Streptomyces sp. I05A-00742]|uniref:ABC transporter permease n=1 Tax=Streptomyces sp. I05A-00742 TaxID=2732853 RepID=UPI001489CEC3|nr:ABC transporter permease [Streptomyces sp. I05A-00742]